MTVYKIPFNKPSLCGNELEYMSEAITSGHISGDGYFTKRCQALLEHVLSAPKVLLTPSCTHALEMAAFLLEIEPGDEVIVPSFTFVSTANAFVLRGARPIFIDIRPDTLNLDERQLEKLITTRTKAILPVHYAGVGCEMEAILNIADRNAVAVVEDNAHGLFGQYKGKFLGTFGCFGTQSFHETKNFSCGEGGALIINNSHYITRAEVIREKGTNRSRALRGKLEKYMWVDIGSSYLLSDILAAFLLGQLETQEQVQARRHQIWEYYYEHLKGWAQDNGVQLPFVPPHCQQSYHMFYLVLPSPFQRESLIRYLNATGIKSVAHYLPLHLSEMGRRLGAKEGDCPVAEELSQRLLRLPLYNTLSDSDQERIVSAILDFPES